MDVYAEVKNFILRESLLTDGQQVIAGVSGGPDSLTLLDVLVHLGYKVIAAHLDHALRPSSGEEAEFVRKTAEMMGCECVVHRLEDGRLDSPGNSMEEAAREHRYRFLLHTAIEMGVSHIAVGHTADDQVETIVMHFLRGAGPAGLRGMLPKRPMSQWAPELSVDSGKVSLVRPLLPLSRSQTIQHCKSIGVEPRWDESNLDTTFFRNRLRLELLPLMESYNPGVRNRLLQTAQLMVEDVEFRDEEVDRRWRFLFRECGPRCVAVHRERFLEMPMSIRRNSIFSLLQSMVPQERNLAFSHVKNALQGIALGTPARIPLIGDLEMVQSGEEAIICPVDVSPVFTQYPQVGEAVEVVDLSRIQGKIGLGSGWYITYQVFDKGTLSGQQNVTGDLNRSRAAFDLIELKEPIEVRRRKPGDRLIYNQRGNSKKVSDFMMEKGLPVRARWNWPVLAARDGLLWIPGIRRSTMAPISPSGGEIIVFELSHAITDLCTREKMNFSGIDQSRSITDSAPEIVGDENSHLIRDIHKHGDLLQSAWVHGMVPAEVYDLVHAWQDKNGVMLFYQQNEIQLIGDSAQRLILTAEGEQIISSFLRYCA